MNDTQIKCWQTYRAIRVQSKALGPVATSDAGSSQGSNLQIIENYDGDMRRRRRVQPSLAELPAARACIAPAPVLCLVSVCVFVLTV